MTSTTPPPFSHPPLPQRGDALRLLILLPGETPQQPTKDKKDEEDYDDYNDQDDDNSDQDDDKHDLDDDDTHDPIICELVPRTFASKPIYECLSYTWGQEQADKRITVNGQEFLVRKNLFSALRQMRQDKPRALWVDAICINQSDIPERNSQVSMMAFVYRRATRVLVWLGVAPEKYQDIDRELNIIRSGDNAKAMANHPYWTRLWIIQEIILAQDIIFMHGSFEIPGDQFTHKLDTQYMTLKDLAIPLLEHRSRRDTDEYRLEMLISKFQNAQCVEKRDKIFGFLGLANDVDEEIEVDYEMELFDLYKKLLAFHQNGRPLYDGPFGPGILPQFDRAARLMKFSSLLKKTFEGRLEEEAKVRCGDNRNNQGSGDDEDEFYFARGALAGEILHLGPTYSEVVSSYRANKKWKIDIERIYASKPGDELRELRQSEEEYSTLLLDWDEAYLEQVQNVRSKTSYGFRWIPDTEDILPSRISRLDIGEPNNITEGAEDEGEPRRFLATDSRIGFAPPGTKVGDFVYNFFDCGVAVVLRRTADEINDRWEIIGKADLNHRGLKEGAAQRISMAGINFDKERFAGFEDALKDWDFKKTMNLKMDIDVLQKLS